MSTALDDLDWQSHEILRTLAEHDQTLTSTQIRETTPIDDNRKILYRIENKLVPSDLVTVEQPRIDDASVAPKEITLTDTGAEFGQRLIDVSDTEFTAEDIPAQLDKLTATLDSMEGRLSEVESESDQQGAEHISNQGESVAKIATTVAEFDDSSFGAWDDQEAAEYELIRAGMLALRDIVMDELDYSPDEIEAAVQQHQREQERE